MHSRGPTGLVIYLTVHSWCGAISFKILCAYFNNITYNPVVILVNNQLDTQFFIFVYLYFLHMLLHTRRSSTQSDINQVSH